MSGFEYGWAVLVSIWPSLTQPLATILDTDFGGLGCITTDCATSGSFYAQVHNKSHFTMAKVECTGKLA